MLYEVITTLLFLTPNSGYKIVGSKMAFGAMELFAGIAVNVLLVWITNSVALSKGYEGLGQQLQLLIERLKYPIQDFFRNSCPCINELHKN